MRKITFVVIILLTVNINAQNFKDKEIEKLERFGIDLTNLNKTDQNLQENLNSILLNNRKSKRRKTASIILGSLSAITTTVGIIQVYKNESGNNSINNNEAEAYQNLFGSLLIAVGTIEAGIAIPLFVSSKKKKKIRNELITIYNKDFN